MRVLDALHIEQAAARIDPIFLDTPLLRESSLDRVLGAELLLKVETLNPTRAFKGRGTDNFVASLENPAPLVTASAGNFGQGLARAGARRGLAVTVFAATNANPLKIDAMRTFGADVQLVGSDFDAAKAAGRAHAQSLSLAFVEDGAHPAIAEGAGTIAREVTRAGQEVDVALIALGNGALATGIGTWFKTAAPDTRIVGIVAEGAPVMLHAFEGRPTEDLKSDTIADGIAVREAVPYAVASMAATIDEVVAIPDQAILQAMRLVHDHLGLVVEPAGVVGIAAILTWPDRWRQQRVLTVLCGGNMTPEQMAVWL